LRMGSGLCAPSPADDLQVSDMLRRVARFESNHDLQGSWRSYITDLVNDLESASPSPRRTLRVLVASLVSTGMLETVAYNMKRLSRNRAGDVFKLALFHYLAEEGQVPSLESSMESTLRPHIALEHAGGGCKPMFWRRLTPDLVAGFDYVWLLDGDLRMDYFEWDLYRHVLLKEDPLVSQPSILGWAPGNHSTIFESLRMRAPQGNGTAELFRQVRYVEIMPPVLSDKIWLAVHARVMGIDGLYCRPVEGIYNTIAKYAVEAGCSKTDRLVVNLSPLRHANCHDMTRTKTHCLKGFPSEQMFPITAAETDALVRDVGGACARGRERATWEGRKVYGYPVK